MGFDSDCGVLFLAMGFAAGVWPRTDLKKHGPELSHIWPRMRILI